MYLVRFTNFAYSKQFPSMESAVAHMKRACFEAVLTDTRGTILGTFSPISGFSQK